MPTDFSLAHYLAAARGLRGEVLATAADRFGPNSFAIPARTFGSLFVEHALAPFFVFQVFCVVLWSLDDYWYYSLFTLLMLVIFESTVVTSRMRNLDEMRELATPPCAALALRDGKWTPLSSEELLPGDIISLARAEDRGSYTFNGAFAEVEAACPADVVLLHGSVTVNESALTGESTPMLKVPLEAAVADSETGGKSHAPLSFTAHKASIVLGGTKILQHSSGGQPAALQPPGGGAIGYVLRTGFYSSSGELIRTILFASERASENSKETFVFILFLLSFAVLAAGYVLIHGLADPTRSRWRLLLHCTMILTSVVPPELPMELSLAVNNSLLALHKLGIYCTEPFRIPYAGRCHMCCFDKTGTLTLSDLIVEGVAVPRDGRMDLDSGASATAAGVTAAGVAAAAPRSSRPSQGKAKTARKASAKSDAVESDVDSAGKAGATGSAFGADASAMDTFPIISAAAVPLDASFVLAGCHQLVSASGKLLGDPMERAALLAAGWSYHADAAIRETALANPVDLTADLRAAFADHSPPRPTLRILKRFAFSSELKRASAIIDTGLALGSGRPDPSGRLARAASASGVSSLRVVAKGSPEAVRAMLAEVPEGYDATYMRFASRGKRVLALASKALPGPGGGASGTVACPPLTRAEAERGLTFCGFLVLHCPPRPESKGVLSALRTSGHTLQMLTGDSLLTATYTAHSLGLATKPALLLQVEGTSESAPAAEAAPAPAPAAVTPPRTPGASHAARPAPVAVRSPIEKYVSARMQQAPFPGKAAAAAGSVPRSSLDQARLRWAAWAPDMAMLDVGATGYAPSVLPPGGYLGDDLSAAYFRELARRFDLCVAGDGFAALERAGALPCALPYLRVLARMAPAQKEVALATLHDSGLVAMMTGDGTNDVGALKQSAVGVALVTTSLVAPPPPPKATNRGEGGEGPARESPAERQQRKLRERMAQELSTAPTVKLGDASIAAAFTARSASVSSCVDVITQGRCTLVTTTQMFKILSLNCLISAYALSVLHLKGVRMSDTQATASGLLTAALFLFVSFSKPLPKLAPRRPPPSALAPSVLFSIAGQFVVHLRTTMQGFQLGQAAAASAFEPPPEADAEFEPTMTNTIVFLLSSAMLLTTFAANYTGRPYMGSLSSNKGMMATLIISAALVVLLTTGSVPDLASYLELQPLPDFNPSGDKDGGAIGSELLSLMAMDFALCFGIEKGLNGLFRY